MSLRCPPPVFEQKICRLEDLAERAASLPHPTVFTNGVFDILHRGHVTYLAQARALGASLIVAVNSDASVKLLSKGDDRRSIRKQIVQLCWPHLNPLILSLSFRTKCR